jgi:hypothetical protein
MMAAAAVAALRASSSLATAHAAAGRVRASDEDARVGVNTILL